MNISLWYYCYLWKYYCYLWKQVLLLLFVEILLLFVEIGTIVICGNRYYCYLWKQVLLLFVEIGTYYCYFSQHKGKSQKKWAGPEELWNDKKQQAALEHQKQRRERGIE